MIFFFLTLKSHFLYFELEEIQFIMFMVFYKQNTIYKHTQISFSIFFINEELWLNPK